MPAGTRNHPTVGEAETKGGVMQSVHAHADDLPTADEDQDAIDDWIDSQRRATSTQSQTGTHPVAPAPSVLHDP
jgi:hypothetical protein